ncbi:uncharacterized protein MELLADRAFT_70638 [Melampsora larici-populina 98AG31]|uniref:Uncharacterized protein n=1 Tax=Melampsora larici-populina (strain 98AG31 / pathotype 3-4-7) TaxID=747676 RepID=F4R6Y9_MELLP|nr:uncharacterized protein MELLADRAFT_70638 [Melampsora larici-populina 98AG31]EGG12371.1 hypothetical protein MELLADRAFT_70638 [Melampsora larici-populina 98AG31]
MAELDLYGDLYGDVDDPGSPVELSPQPPPPIDDQLPASDIKPVVSSASIKGESNGPQPTTFSISTYEDNYANKKSDHSRETGTESGWQAPSSRLPLSPALQSPSAGSGGRPALWGVKPSDMPDEGSVLFALSRPSASFF